MKIFKIIAFSLTVFMSQAQETFYDFKMKSLTGQEVDFSQFKGKKIIVLNVASKCGFTPQYAEWEKFYSENKDSVVVLGFPANNFGAQEQGSNEEIAAFCKKNYGVTFPMFSKIDVKGDNKAPLYKWLTNKELNGWNTEEPSWNFCKYVINETGELTFFFNSKVTPSSGVFLEAMGL